jgi:hypothetical protein
MVNVLSSYGGKHSLRLDCRKISGRMNSCRVEFENGQTEVVSRNALRKPKGEK